MTKIGLFCFFIIADNGAKKGSKERKFFPGCCGKMCVQIPPFSGGRVMRQIVYAEVNVCLWVGPIVCEEF